ncbi:MAG: MBL fold metallo-hydrolase [Anaerolineales bacterium]
MKNSSNTYVVPLGVAAALADAYHANSYLAVVHEGRYWLVDCADAPIGRLERGGLDPLALQGLILTHFHPDHVYGLPNYLLGLYLLGYADVGELCIYARSEVLEGARPLLSLFRGQGWIEQMLLSFVPLEPEVGALVTESEDFRITVAPSCHSIPSLAVRFESRKSGRVFVYSSDTAICAEVQQLAEGADLLFHEATGEGHGHADPVEVGAMADQMGVERLVLIHYNPRKADEILAAARKTFPEAELAREFVRYPL